MLVAMGDVVELQPTSKEIGYWTCNCGCTTHHVRSDGEIECASCGVQAECVGYWRIPHEGELPRAPTEEDAPTFSTKQVELSFSRQRWAKRASSGEFLILIGLKEDGGVSVQYDEHVAETNDQRAWLRRRLREAYTMIRGKGKSDAGNQD